MNDWTPEDRARFRWQQKQAEKFKEWQDSVRARAMETPDPWRIVSTTAWENWSDRREVIRTERLDVLRWQARMAEKEARFQAKRNATRLANIDKLRWEKSREEARLRQKYSKKFK